MAKPAKPIFLHGKVQDHCNIREFPKPYKFSATCYTEDEFEPEVEEACLSAGFHSLCLRVSKIIVVGDISVGKTCLVKRFCHNSFDGEYKQTIGVDFDTQRFDILNSPFTLQIWDTAGHERFRSIASAYYRGAHVIIVTFDLNSMFSLQTSVKWLEEAMQYNTDAPLIFLVGTKLDLVNKVLFSMIERDAIKLASSIGAEFWPVSSKTGENVMELFCRIAALSFTKYVLKELEPDPERKGDAVRISSQRLDLKPTTKKKGCAMFCGK